MKTAIFHDYFGAIGGGEKVVITLANLLNADIITTDMDAVNKLDAAVNVISLGHTKKIPPLKQISATKKFYSCDLLTVAVHTHDQKPYDWHDKQYSFDVIPTCRDIGLFDVPCNWKI